MKEKQILKNRIVGTGEKPAGEFNANPLNWRRHPEKQRAAISAVLDEIGWVHSVIVNRTTGNTIDGHARIEDALKRGKETLVPFHLVDLTLEEEKKILALFDKITSLAVTDVEAYQLLLDETVFESPVLTEITEFIPLEEIDPTEFFEETGLGAVEKFTIEIKFDTEKELKETVAALNRIDPNMKIALKTLLKL